MEQSEGDPPHQGEDENFFAKHDDDEFSLSHKGHANLNYSRAELFAIRDAMPRTLQIPQFPTSFIDEMSEMKKRREYNREKYENRRTNGPYRKPWRNDPWDMPNTKGPPQPRDREGVYQPKNFPSKYRSGNENMGSQKGNPPLSESIDVDKLFATTTDNDFRWIEDKIEADPEAYLRKSDETESFESRGFRRWFSAKESSNEDDETNDFFHSLPQQSLASTLTHPPQTSTSAFPAQQSTQSVSLEMLFQSAQLEQSTLPPLPQSGFSSAPLTESELLRRQQTRGNRRLPDFPVAQPSPVHPQASSATPPPQSPPPFTAFSPSLLASQPLMPLEMAPDSTESFGALLQQIGVQPHFPQASPMGGTPYRPVHNGATFHPMPAQSAPYLSPSAPPANPLQQLFNSSAQAQLSSHLPPMPTNAKLVSLEEIEKSYLRTK